jgi:hypothetical protein
MPLFKTVRGVILVLCEKTMQTLTHWVTYYLFDLIGWFWFFQGDLFLILFILLLNLQCLFITVIDVVRIIIMLMPPYWLLFHNLSVLSWLNIWICDLCAVSLLVLLFLFLLIDPFQKLFRIHINLLEQSFDIIWWLFYDLSVNLWHFYLMCAPHFVWPRKHLIIVVTWHRSVIIHDFLEVDFFYLMFLVCWI